MNNNDSNNNGIGNDIGNVNGIGNGEPQQPQQLTHEKVYELAGVFARLEQLRNAPPDIQILRPNGENSRTPNTEQLTREAEMQALIEHACHTFLRHSGEFLGAWLTMKTEYLPLLVALAPIVKRCNEMPAVQAPLAPESMRSNVGNKEGDGDVQ